jgi:hypothetical protein
MMKIEGSESGSGSTSQSHGSADPDPSKCHGFSTGFSTGDTGSKLFYFYGGQSSAIGNNNPPDVLVTTGELGKILQ